MQGNEMLHRMETLRRRLEETSYRAGSLYDYLDRGQPSSQQRADTWAAIDECSNQIADMEQQLSDLVETARHQNPELVERWIDIHQAIYREIGSSYAMLEEDVAEPLPLEPQMATFVAERAIQKWEKVRAGKACYVLANRALLDHHGDTVIKHFGF